LPTLKVLKLHPEAKLPGVAYGTRTAGYDLFFLGEERPDGSLGATFIPPGGIKFLRTGIAIEFTPMGNGIIFDKSGLARQGHLSVGNVVDADYRGEVIVQRRNLNPDATLRIDPGDKCAQMLYYPFFAGEVIEAQELTDTSRGAKGFGSSGK
jgi:dUTP pyrophosphatase